VANGDKADLTVDLYRRVYINDAPNVNLLAQGITVGTSAVALPATSLAGRTRLMIQNRGGQSVFVGGSGVAISSGMEVTKGATMTLEAGPALIFYAISGSAGNDVRIIEIA
jgi:catalase (peroxidase I)